MILALGTTPVYQRSMVLERLRLNDVNRARAVYDYASGKAVNVGRVLHTLGREVVVMGFAGGPRGAAMLADMERAGVPHAFVQVHAPTRQCVTVIDRATGTATELVEESGPVAADELNRLDEQFLELVPKARGCVFSGSLAPGTPASFYRDGLERVRAGVPVVIDARGEPLKLALGTRPFVAKLNREELAATVDRALEDDGQVAGAAREIAPAGGAAVVTLGADGAIAVEADAAWRVFAPRVITRSAVGSGDALAAGLIDGLLRGLPMPQACAFGVACGAANAMTELAGHLLPADVNALLRQVRVEPMPA
jgi:tagatose 6-phosphate kinase